ncbi:MAG: alpha-ketoglutarate-dependent dioxygenase AlkB [Cyanobacteria bacterium P01_D01_bin.115]
MNQLALFAETTPSLHCIHYPNWLDQVAADALFEKSLELDWQQNTTQMWGKTMPLPRREAIYGDEAYQYSYSRGKVVLTAQPWLPWLSMLRDLVQAATGYRFPLVIGNRYDSGRDHIGWHDDNRPEIGPMPAIASVSFGATRRFQTRPKPTSKGEKTPITTLYLGHGDLIVMPPGFQETHLHRIVKESERAQPETRINWTFRPWAGGLK